MWSSTPYCFSSKISLFKSLSPLKPFHKSKKLEANYIVIICMHMGFISPSVSGLVSQANTMSLTKQFPYTFLCPNSRAHHFCHLSSGGSTWKGTRQWTSCLELDSHLQYGAMPHYFNMSISIFSKTTHHTNKGVCNLPSASNSLGMFKYSSATSKALLRLSKGLWSHSNS